MWLSTLQSNQELAGSLEARGVIIRHLECPLSSNRQPDLNGNNWRKADMKLAR
jgi:hypothetical protein